ncbi:hypothetical protein [Corallococcus sp. EGB]|uniref:hypothetical protein n=1 Tax=Corallococcus sp. EGB TaxID=1521117 RepID=UPI001CBD4F5B|nr:hypothetical protein [Corallococcus sp. EGB]
MSLSREAAPSSRLRHWASRLLLLVACASVVATSKTPTSEDVNSDPYSGRPVTLTTKAPKTRIPVVMRVTASQSPDKPVEAVLQVRVSATWTPADPSEAVSPWLRAMLVTGDLDSGPQAGGVLVAGQPTEMDVQQYLDGHCTLGTSCDWTTNLDLELQPNAAAGEVTVEWTATGQAHVVDTTQTPNDFTVTVSEP